MLTELFMRCPGTGFASIARCVLCVVVMIAARRAMQEAPAPTGVLQGRVVDGEGKPVLAGWEVHADLASGHDGEPLHLQARSDEHDDGSFRWEAVVPGAYKFTIYARSGHASAYWSAGPTAVVTADADALAPVEVVFTGGRPEHAIALRVHSHRKPFMLPGADALRAMGPFASRQEVGVDDSEGLLLLGPLPDAVDADDVQDDGELTADARERTGLMRVPSRRGLHFRGHNDLAYEDLPDGRYFLTLVARGYVTTRTPEISPGSEAEVQLEVIGACALHLLVVDAQGGAAVERFSAEADLFRYGVREGKPWPYGVPGTLLEDKHYADGDVLVEGLVPGEWKLTLRSPGYQEQEAVVAVPAEGTLPREVTLRMHRTASMFGTVLSAEGAPLAGIDVGVFAPAGEDAAPDVPFHTHRVDWNIAQPGPWFRSEQRFATTDAEGRFTITDVDSGSWIVRAYASSTLDDVREGVTIAAGASVSDLDFVLPPGTWLQGRVLVPAGATAKGLSLQGWPMRGDDWRAFPSETAVAEDGSFRLGPFGPGELALWLRMAGDWMPVNMPYSPGQFDPQPQRVLMRTIAPLSGTEDVTLAQDIDLGDAFPARVHVVARRNGTPAAGAWTQLVDAATGAHLATAVLDDQGAAVLGRFFAGEARLVVSGEGWFAYADATVTPPPGGVAELDADLTTAAGRVVLIDDAAGAPLADEVVCIYTHTPFGWSPQVLRTDAQGGLAFELAPTQLACLHLGARGEGLLPRPGVFSNRWMGELPYPPEPDAAMPRLTWTAGGPQPVVLRVPRSSP